MRKGQRDHLWGELEGTPVMAFRNARETRKCISRGSSKEGGGQLHLCVRTWVVEQMGRNLGKKGCGVTLTKVKRGVFPPLGKGEDGGWTGGGGGGGGRGGGGGGWGVMGGGGVGRGGGS